MIPRIISVFSTRTAASPHTTLSSTPSARACENARKRGVAAVLCACFVPRMLSSSLLSNGRLPTVVLYRPGIPQARRTRHPAGAGREGERRRGGQGRGAAGAGGDAGVGGEGAAEVHCVGDVRRLLPCFVLLIMNFTI